MLISNLPEPLKSLAIQRRTEYLKTKGAKFIETEKISLMAAFDWKETPEGEEFWCLLGLNIDVTNHPKHPNNIITNHFKFY